MSINWGKRSIRGREKKQKEWKGGGMEVEVVEERVVVVVVGRGA